jgi:hypothetical protein
MWNLPTVCDLLCVPPLRACTSCIPKETPGADWRVLLDIVRDDPTKEMYEVRQVGPAQAPQPRTVMQDLLYSLALRVVSGRSDLASPPCGRPHVHVCFPPRCITGMLLTGWLSAAAPVTRVFHWCRPACPTRLHATTAGAACMGAWTWTATSPPAPQTHSPWAR